MTGVAAAALLLAACGETEVAAVNNQAAAAKAAAQPEGDVGAAERLVRERLGNPQGLAFANPRRSASEGVTIICGDYTQAGARHRYIVVGGEEVFLEPQMQRGEMDLAFAEFCREDIAATFEPPMVIPVKVGISGQEVTAGPHETPAFAGVTIWGDRHA